MPDERGQPTAEEINAALQMFLMSQGSGIEPTGPVMEYPYSGIRHGIGRPDVAPPPMDTGVPIPPGLQPPTGIFPDAAGMTPGTQHMKGIEALQKAAEYYAPNTGEPGAVPGPAATLNPQELAVPIAAPPPSMMDAGPDPTAAARSSSMSRDIPVPDEFLTGEVMENDTPGDPLASPLDLSSIIQGSPQPPIPDMMDQFGLANALNERPRRGNPGWARIISAIMSGLGGNQAGAQQVLNQPHQDETAQWQDRIQKLNYLAQREQSQNQLDLESFRLGEERDFRSQQAQREENRFQQSQATTRRGQDTGLAGTLARVEQSGKDRAADRALRQRLADESNALRRELSQAQIAARASSQAGQSGARTKKLDDQTILQIADQHAASMFPELGAAERKEVAKAIQDAIKYNKKTKKYDFDIDRAKSTLWGHNPKVTGTADRTMFNLRYFDEPGVEVEQVGE